nr:E-beta-farnesene synthase [Tanacetum cinerariifolium]
MPHEKDFRVRKAKGSSAADSLGLHIKNLAQHTHEKKKATRIVNLSIRFTKLIIYHLQRKHKFHPRPESPLHLPNKEPVLGYLKFNAKGTKREVFGIHIPGNLIIADIQGESYYQEYLAKPTKTTKKSKPTTPKADPRPPVLKLASSQQTEPKSASTKTQGKKRKLVLEIFEKSSPARKSKTGLVTKRRKPTSSLRPVDESVAKGICEKEHRVNDEEANVQRELEESLKSIYDVPRGPLPPVVIKEPESGKGEGKEKVIEEQMRMYRGLMWEVKVKARLDQTLMLKMKARSDPEHMDLDVADVSTQPHHEQMDEGFTTMAYPKVQENLKLMVEEQVILEEPTSSSRTLSSLQHLTKDLIFGELFFNDKPSEANNEKKLQRPKPNQWCLSRSNKIQKRRDLPKTPPGSPPHQPPPPLPASPSGASGSPRASGSSQVPPPNPLPPSTNQEDWWKPLKEERPTTLEPAWFIPSSDVHVLMYNWASALASTYTPPPKDSLLAQTVDIAMFMDCKGSRPALLISKMKAAYYPDVGLEKMVPDQMWIEEECKHTSEGDRRAVRTHMRILSVVRIEVFSIYRVQMIMRFNEIHKFSHGTLQQIDEALDYRFKEFKINRMNPGLNTRFWTRKDVDRSKEFMFAIQK